MTKPLPVTKNVLAALAPYVEPALIFTHGRNIWDYVYEGLIFQEFEMKTHWRLTKKGEQLLKKAIEYEE